MRELFNMMRAAANMEGQTRAVTRHGIITSYDPDTHAVKVTIQPDNTVTGWLPLKAAAVGAGFGIIYAPALGEAVEVNFQEDNGGVGTAGLRFFNDEDRPPNCPAGEWLMQHKSGATMRWTNDGKWTLNDASGAIVQLSNDNKVRITCDELIVSSKITAGGDITTMGDVSAGTVSLKNHLTTDVTAGSDLSGKPQQ